MYALEYTNALIVTAVNMYDVEANDTRAYVMSSQPRNGLASEGREMRKM